MYLITFYLIKLNPMTFEPEGKPIHHYIVETKEQAEFLEQAFKGSGTCAIIEEIEDAN